MVTIDGTEYTEDQLTEEQKYMVAQIKDLEAKISGTHFQLDQLVAAKTIFSDTLLKSFEDEAGAEE